MTQLKNAMARDLESVRRHRPESRKDPNALRLRQLYSCLQTFTAEMIKIIANPGKRIEFGTTPRSKPPMNVPTTDPIAIASMNCQLARSTEKL